MDWSFICNLDDATLLLIKRPGISLRVIGEEIMEAYKSAKNKINTANTLHEEHLFNLLAPEFYI